MESIYRREDADEAGKRIGKARREIARIQDELAAKRRAVIYALASDPDYVIFDVELFVSEHWPAGASWFEWEPLAVARGPGLSRGNDGHWSFLVAGGKRYGAQEVLGGECESIEVSFIGAGQADG